MTTIIARPAVRLTQIEEAWDLYRRLFTDVDELAAQRHLMTYEEFAEVYHDPRVLKLYEFDDSGHLIGMSVLTQHLDAWPLISPRYFARHYPSHFHRQAIWYVGFVGVLPRYPHVFRSLVERMYPPVIATNGVAVMDFCAYNLNVRRLPAITLRLLGSINSAASMEIADSQTFAVYRFDQSEVRA